VDLAGLRFIRCESDRCLTSGFSPQLRLALGITRPDGTKGLCGLPTPARSNSQLAIPFTGFFRYKRKKFMAISTVAFEVVRTQMLILGCHHLWRVISGGKIRRNCKPALHRRGAKREPLPPRMAAFTHNPKPVLCPRVCRRTLPRKHWPQRPVRFPPAPVFQGNRQRSELTSNGLAALATPSYVNPHRDQVRITAFTTPAAIVAHHQAQTPASPTTNACGLTL